jgi:hypothetical protein
MRKTMSISTRIVLVILCAILLGKALNIQGSQDDKESRILRAVMVFDTLAHAGATYNVGDNFTTVGRVVSVDGKPFDGRLAFACQITDVAAGAGACLYYFFLPGGEVTGTGDVRDGIEFPITGGTGDYVRTSGTVLITHTSESGPRQAVFRFSRRP